MALVFSGDLCYNQERKLKTNEDNQMYYIILNPASKSGQGISLWKKLEPILADRQISYRLLLSHYAGHVARLVTEIMEKHPSEKPVNLILLGGDGTLNEALQGVSDFSRIHIGYIPTGSSNDFARDLELPQAPEEILERILANEQAQELRLLDIGVLDYDVDAETRRRYFAVSSGIGFDAAVCQEALASKLKDLLNRLHLGKLTYVGIALKQLIKAKRVSCDLTLDGAKKIHFDRFLFIASMLHQYEGGGFKFCPGADATDGIFDLCAAGAISKPKILVALPTAFKGDHFKFREIERFAASEIDITTSAPLWVHTDGEVPCKTTHLHISCLKEQLRMLV